MSLLKSTPRSALTKLLHLLLLLCIFWQLLAVQWVEPPTATETGNWFYSVHQWVGLATLGLVTVFWLWCLVRREETQIAALFPWGSRERLKALKADLRLHVAAVRQYRLPTLGEATPLASAVHGLGLTTALIMGVSGAWLFAMAAPDGLVLEIHKTMSNLMWAYVVLHASLGVLHQFGGHRLLQRMFTFAPKSRR